MKLLFSLILTLLINLAFSLPPIEDVRAQLSSPDLAVRKQITNKLWEAQHESIDLLKTLTSDENPEISIRAKLILQNLKFGISPDTSGDLLKRVKKVEEAAPNQRFARLTELLQDESGLIPALKLLDRWLSHQKLAYQKELTLITESIFEQRSQWKVVFQIPLSPVTRAALITEIIRQDIPMKESMVALLAVKNTALVYANLKHFATELKDTIPLTLARTAILADDTELALEILASEIPQDEDLQFTRAYAFLEHLHGARPGAYKGLKQAELAVFRARLKGDPKEILRLNDNLGDNHFLRYENLLHANQLTLPSDSNFTTNKALSALHQHFGTPSSTPDIEALSANILLGWPTLARTLVLIDSPLEAAELLLSNSKPRPAVNILWQTGHREKALAIAEKQIASKDFRESRKMSLLLAKLYHHDQEHEKARLSFAPLLNASTETAYYFNAAVDLAQKLYPRKTLLEMMPSIGNEKSYQRRASLAALLPYPKDVSDYWYQHFLEHEPEDSPLNIINKLETFLKENQNEARKIISSALAKDHKTDFDEALYENALYLKIPKALELAEQKAWREPSIEDLLQITSDPDWPLPIRLKALKSALTIEPTNISARYYDHQLNQNLTPLILEKLTLADPYLALTSHHISHLPEPQKQLHTAISVSSLKEAATIRAQAQLALSSYQQKSPQATIHHMHLAFCGETAAGIYPPTDINKTLSYLRLYYQARATQETDEAQKRKSTPQ